MSPNLESAGVSITLEWVHNPEAWLALGTLVALEIVLGIDNIIFISILVGRLPAEQQNLARRLGPGLAMLTRLALSFLLLIGFMLVAEGFDVHIPKGYIYFAMFFSVGVEVLDSSMRKKREVASLRLSKKITESETA